MIVENQETSVTPKHPSGIYKVVVIAKTERFDTLKSKMDKIGITGMTVTKVSGCGVQTVVDAARKALYTGHMGDGKIFIYEVENVVRISSGAQREKALIYER
nr:P-II family nitrogen regulator [Allocoprobacillus halotolerans]